LLSASSVTLENALGTGVIPFWAFGNPELSDRLLLTC
jgi:hypothetical protein